VKKRSSFLALMCFCFFLAAQATKTVQVSTAGTLHSQISANEADTITSIVISGNIDARDIAFIRDKVVLLTTLDLLNATIVAYTGTEGTNTGVETAYPANELPAYAFYNPCLQTYKSSLTSLKLPKYLVSIGSLACYFCWNLSGQLSIPATVKSIADFAFYGCYALTAFSVSTSNTRYSSSNGVLFSKNQDTLLLFPNAKTDKYVIPSSVKHVYRSAFENAFALTGLTIPSSVTSIGSYAFCNCSGITGNLSLPGSLTNLEDGAFYGCYNLNGTVSIPASLKQLGTFCFFECNSIQSFSVNASNTKYSSKDGVLYSKNQDTLFICPNGQKGTFTIPSTVRLIGSYAFYKCESLTGNIQIPMNADYIGYDAFYGCKNISSYTVDAQNIYFSGVDGVLYSKKLDRLVVCPALKSGSFNILDGVKYVDPCAFSFCSALTGSLNIPASVESLGSFAFYGCSSISGFTVDAGNLYYSAQDGLLFNKNIDTLYICPLTKSGQYEVPSGVRCIGPSAFDGCSALTEVLMPATLVELGDYAFEYCSGLTAARIPSSVSKFGIGVYYSCPKLMDLVVERSEPPVVDYYFLEGIDKTSCKLTVPTNVATLYQKAPYWKEFANILEADIGTNIRLTRKQTIKTFIRQNELTVTGLLPGKNLEVIMLDGRCLCRKTQSGETLLIQLPGKGIYIIKTGNQSTKIVY